MSGTDIFLSYARADRAVARVYADCFVEEGFTVWWDASLHSGQTFDEVIEQKLREAKAVVVLWSPRSVASRWVRAEATQADRRNKLVPAMIEPCDRPIVFELTHAAELSGWHGDTTDPSWRTFMNDVRRLVGPDQSDGAHVPIVGGSAVPRPLTEGAAADSANAAPAVSQHPHPPGKDAIVANPASEGLPVRQPNGHHATDDDALAEVHCLEMEDEGAEDGLFIIDSSGLKIGRSAPADIIVADKSISREHCIIGIANDELILTDLNSTNGTFIDDVRIKRSTILPVGSVVRFGHVSLRHAIHTRAEAQRRGAAPAPRTGRPQAGQLAISS